MSQSEPIRVLVVDDDLVLLTVTERVLSRQGFVVQLARDGLEAKELLQKSHFDVIVSDINMPGYGGLEFLRAVRHHDMDVPVILRTGKPTVDSSIRAIEHGVFRYLVKPVPNEALIDVVGRAARLHKIARLKRQALEIAGLEGKWVGDRAALEARFQNATEHLWVAFQPVVSIQDRQVFGYEALLRTSEPTMANPFDFVEAAERLGKVQELGNAVRTKVADAAPRAPADVTILVNVHVTDLSNPSLCDASSPLSRIAHRVVLEISERASLDAVKGAPSQVTAVKAMGFRIAVDNLGAGYAGLTSFTCLEPEVVKLDMSLTRGIEGDPKRQSIVRSMRTLCSELGMRFIAGGVQTAVERDTLAELGCELFQGDLFGVPGRDFGHPHW